MTSAQAALDAAVRGHPEALDGVHASTPADHALLCAARLYFDRPGGREPSAEEIEPLLAGSEEARRAGGEACALLERRALLAFDATSLGRWTDLHARLSGPADMAVRLARAWTALLRGDDLSGLDDPLRQIQHDAAAANDPVLAVAATSTRALASLERGDLPGALEAARRASLMASSEGIAEAICWANLVLARVRRHSGRPYLATRILGAIAGYAPGAFREWIALESVLAGSPEATSAPDGAAAQVRLLLGAATQGDRALFDRVAAGIDERVAGFESLRDEVRTLVAAVDCEREPPDSVRAWREGASDLLPRGLQGVSSSAAPQSRDEPVLVFVATPPGRRSARMLRAGAGLLVGAQAIEPSKILSPRNARTDTGLAALALSGDAGLANEELFRRVYGFPYVAHVHDATARKLVHRMRERLGALGEIRRTTAGLVLVPAALTLIPDPRFSQTTADRALGALAKSTGAEAADIARALGIPLRTAQLALQQLVADGGCRLERIGRQVVYRLDDTTFSEPTALTRLITD